MKKLLIHNQNTFLADGMIFSNQEQFVFDPDFDVIDVDHYITNQLLSGDLKDKLAQAEVVFIKVALTNNYLEYMGIRLAYHLRLTESLGEKTNIPIIFVAEESYQFLGLTSQLSEILFTKGIYLMRDSKDDLDKFKKLINEGRIQNLLSLEEFISKIQVPPPANYQTHHSIANEWCILRWAEMASNISEGEREVIKKEIKTTDTLYYKYLEAQYINLSSESARQKFKRDDNRKALLVNRDPKVNAKIYYIDDEAHKGWGMLFKEVIFKPFTQDSLFDYYDEFKKGEKRESLLARLKSKIKSLINDEGYNVFIIDLRLCDDDFHNGIDPCGFELIKEIKKINKGVQVVIFTASKKAENVNKALLAGVENYVLKESPENVLTREGSYQLYLEFYRKVTNAISKSYLASVHMTIKHLKSTTLFAGSTNDAQKLFRADTIGKDGSLDKIFSLVESRNDAFINYSVLTAFSTLEKFASLYFLSTSASGKVEKSDTSLFTVYTEAPNQKINTIFHFIRGRFSFQKSTANETIVDVVFQASHELHSKNDFEGPDKSSLTKIISVLKYRYSFDDIRLIKLIELRYLRSNLAAHNTGNIDESKRKIEIEDMSFLLGILKDVF